MGKSTWMLAFSKALVFWRYVWILHKNANSAAWTEYKLKVTLNKIWSTYYFCKALAGIVENTFIKKKHFLFIYVHCVVLASNRHTTVSVSHIIKQTDKTKSQSKHSLNFRLFSTCYQNWPAPQTIQNPDLTLQRFALQLLKENTDGAISNFSKVFFLKFIHGWDDNYDFYKNQTPLHLC